MIRAAQQATTTIAIVMAFGVDPVSPVLRVRITPYGELTAVPSPLALIVYVPSVAVS